MHALMSYTIAQRTREMDPFAARCAATPVAKSLFGRATGQLSIDYLSCADQCRHAVFAEAERSARVDGYRPGAREWTLTTSLGPATFFSAARQARVGDGRRLSGRRNGPAPYQRRTARVVGAALNQARRCDSRRCEQSENNLPPNRRDQDGKGVPVRATDTKNPRVQAPALTYEPGGRSFESCRTPQ
jgi:hypothetical protein